MFVMSFINQMNMVVKELKNSGGQIEVKVIWLYFLFTYFSPCLLLGSRAQYSLAISVFNYNPIHVALYSISLTPVSLMVPESSMSLNLIKHAYQLSFFPWSFSYRWELMERYGSMLQNTFINYNSFDPFQFCIIVILIETCLENS